MGKRPPLGGLKVCGFYIERIPDFGSNWGVGGNSVTGGGTRMRAGGCERAAAVGAAAAAVFEDVVVLT